MKKITVIAKQADKKLEVKEINNDLESLQQLADGIVEFFKYCHGIDIWINKEGYVKEGSNYLYLSDYKTLGEMTGNIIFTARNERFETVSLNDFQQEWIKDHVTILDFTPYLEIYNAPHNLEEAN